MGSEIPLLLIAFSRSVAGISEGVGGTSLGVKTSLGAILANSIAFGVGSFSMEASE